MHRLNIKVVDAVVDLVFGEMQFNPHKVGKPLDLGLSGCFSARRGSYRVIYEIYDESKVVRITAVGHRSDVYRS